MATGRKKAEPKRAMAGRELLPEEIESTQQVEAPRVYAASMNVTGAVNDCLLTFNMPTPISAKLKSGKTEQGLAMQPAVLVHLSPQSAKDLMLLMMDFVAQYEDQWGEIKTEFMRQKAQKK